jgi:hypothetical protein
MEVSRAITYELATHLKQAMPELAQVIEHWPDANTELEFPAISIYGFAPQFRGFAPYTYNQDELDEVAEDVLAGDVKWAVDLWASSQAERHRLFESFFQAMATQFPVLGLSLNLTRYHRVIARYDFVGANFSDTEEQIQRQEYRTRVDLVAQCVGIVLRQENLIKQGEIEFNTFRGDAETTEVEL